MPPETASRRRAPARPSVHVLHPGDVALAERGERLETLLGSCVSIILTDPRRTLAAMCHIVHSGPRPGAGVREGAHAEGARDAMHRLLLGRGIQPRLCEAYVYGGGNMFPGMVRGAHVGEGNAERALAMLADDGIEVLVADLGGATYRRLSWTVGEGEPRVAAVSTEVP